MPVIDFSHYIYAREIILIYYHTDIVFTLVFAFDYIMTYNTSVNSGMLSSQLCWYISSSIL